MHIPPLLHAPRLRALRRWLPADTYGSQIVNWHDLTHWGLVNTTPLVSHHHLLATAKLSEFHDGKEASAQEIFEGIDLNGDGHACPCPFRCAFSFTVHVQYLKEACSHHEQVSCLAMNSSMQAKRFAAALSLRRRKT
jgi:hypothetical protein